MDIDQAERVIAGILAQVEKQYDSFIEEVIINNTEITTLGDIRPQLLRKVHIKIKPRPGTGWQV
jgi:hypothetical protein